MPPTPGAAPFLVRRTLLLRPAKGRDVREAIAEALGEQRVPQAWLVGRGTLEEVELREGREPPRAFATPCRIVSLDGRADASAGSPATAISLSATVARPSLRGPELLTGEVVRARAGELEILLTLLEPAPATRSTDPGDEASAEPSEGAPEREVEAPSPWAAVAAASAEAEKALPPPATRAERMAVRAAAPMPAALTPPSAAPIAPRRSSHLDDPYPEEGDVIEHFAFGRATVIRSDGDEIQARDEATGRTRTLRVSALQVAGPIDEDGLRLYRLTQKRGPS